MLHELNGLPAHVLLVHAVIVLIPLGALFTVLSAVWPAARARLGLISPLTCLVALALVPVTMSAGTWLKHQLHYSGDLEQRIRHHATVAGGFGWYALALFVVSAAVYWAGRGTGRGLRTARAVPWTVALDAVAVAVSVAVTFQLYRVGDAGAQAVWHGVVSAR